MADPGQTHFVGDGCQPAHDPAIDAIEQTWRPEVKALRAQVERTERTMKAHREVAVAAIAGTEKQLIEVRAALTAALEQNERFDRRYREAEAEVERLREELDSAQRDVAQLRDVGIIRRSLIERDQLRAEAERLRLRVGLLEEAIVDLGYGDHPLLAQDTAS